MKHQIVTWLSAPILAFAVLAPPSAATISQGSANGRPEADVRVTAERHAPAGQVQDDRHGSKRKTAPNGRRDETGGDEKHTTEADWVAAHAARDTANSARTMNRISIAGLIIGFATTIAAGAAAYFAWRAAHEAGRSANAAIESHGAFVAAEDASLSVSFPGGGKIEAMTEGVRTTFFDVSIVVANIGRSAAQLEGWRFGENANEQLHILEPGSQWGGFLDLTMSIAPNEEFTVTIIYSTPIRQKMELDVTAELRLVREPNGLERVFANTRKTHLRRGEG